MLKTVRLPQKPGSTEHRGFGFVDFVAKDDAKVRRGSAHLPERTLCKDHCVSWFLFVCLCQSNTIKQILQRIIIFFLFSFDSSGKFFSGEVFFIYLLLLWLFMPNVSLPHCNPGISKLFVILVFCYN